MNPVRGHVAQALQNQRDIVEIARINAWRASVEAARLQKLLDDLLSLGFDVGGGVVVLDELTSTNTNAALSQNQGHVLNALIALKAAINSPAFTGVPTAPTAIQGANSTQLATTEFTQAAINDAIGYLVSSSPTALNTLSELAAALNNDPSFAMTISTALGVRLRFDASQALSAPQKAQAMANLGLSNSDALSEGSTNLWFTGARALAAVVGSLLRYDAAQTLTTAQKLQARKNIGLEEQAIQKINPTVIGFECDFVSPYMSTTAFTNAMVSPDLRVWSANNGHNTGSITAVSNQMLGYLNFSGSIVGHTGITTWDIILGNQKTLNFYGGVTKFYSRFCYNTAMPISAIYKIGFDADVTDGLTPTSASVCACFMLTGTTCALYVANGSGLTTQGGLLTLTFDTIYDFAIVVDSASATVKFYINGTQVGTTVTTNIPTSTDQNTPTMGAGVGAANAGSGAISYSVDAISVYKTLTTARTMYKP